MLADRKQQVSVNGTHSEWINVTSGIPQCSFVGKVKSCHRHYALESHEGLCGQCFNLVSIVRSNLECSYTDSPGRDTSPSQVPSKQFLYSFVAE